MRRFFIGALGALSVAAAAQQKVTVTSWNMAGPYRVTQPFAMDSVNVSGQKFEDRSLLETLSVDAQTDHTYQGALLPSLKDSRSVGVASFFVNNSSYQTVKITVKGPKCYQLYVDGKEASGEVKLAPEHHRVALKFLAEPNDSDSLQVVLESDKDITYTTDKRHPYMLHDLTDGKRVRGIALSADGRYAVLSFQTTARGGQSRWDYEVVRLKDQTVVARPSQYVRWMPRSIAYIEETRENGQRTLYQISPEDGRRQCLACQLPEGSYVVSPTEDCLIMTAEEKGPKADEQVFEVTEMDDRQPGWRNRNYLLRYDLKTGMSQRLTFGNKGEQLADISSDGRYLLVSSSHSRLTKRPTTVTDYLRIDMQTLKADTILLAAEHVDMALFSPDGHYLLFRGNPEAFGRVGCQLPDGVTPSMMENELFLYDLTTKTVKPLTKDFNPSVEGVVWSRADKQVYFSAEDRDYVRLYQLNPLTGAIVQLEAQGDDVFRYSLADGAAVIGYLSYATMAPASAFVASLPASPKMKKGMRLQGLVSAPPLRGGWERCLFDGKTALGDAEVGICKDWNFINSKGDTVYGRLYLPASLSANDSSLFTLHSSDSSLFTLHSSLKKYPLIVYYYGGCSPVSRYFESPYAPQYWNSLGYVAYILQPSGATGFGQEWSSRHVNTAGGGLLPDGTVEAGTPAGDIIEGVKRLCEAHPFINREKIGCMGASYGGFMTQYLQTVTDLFAAAVSHAGISNHTSYWGEGYWGYNYSEVSMANSYPWSHRQLYVDQSPLFRADKIHTPLLLLHGTADTNVPLIESLQMFTALKLLGREVSLVEVEGQNHHITDYQKREKWLATQMAWFQKWLKDDPSWWDALYPKKNL